MQTKTPASLGLDQALQLWPVVQEAEAQISALVGACAAAIQKEEKAAQAALTKVASQHEAKMGQCEQRMQDAHAAYQAVVAAEWAELQKTVSSHAVVLQVNSWPRA